MSGGMRVAAFLLVTLFGLAGTAVSQVKKVEMRIGGYLCGN